jgi:O-antigen ligase
MVLRRPLRGFGPESFTTEFPGFQSLELARAYPDFYYESPHNLFLDVAISQGAPSALILLALTAYGLRAAWRFRFEQRQLALCLGATLVATTLCQQFTVFVVPSCLLFYLTLSILIGASVKDAREGSSGPVNLLLVAVSLTIVLILAAATLALAVSDTALSLALSTLRERRIGASLQYYERSRAWRVGGSNADLLYSRAMAAASADPILSTVDRKACWQAALSVGIRAAETSENAPNAHYNLALLMINQGELERAEWSLRSAVSASPNWFKPHWALAVLLQRMNRYDEATAEAVSAVEKSGGRNPKVIATLLELRGHHATW